MISRNSPPLVADPQRHYSVGRSSYEDAFEELLEAIGVPESVELLGVSWEAVGPMLVGFLEGMLWSARLDALRATAQTVPIEELQSAGDQAIRSVDAQTPELAVALLALSYVTLEPALAVAAGLRHASADELTDMTHTVLNTG